MNRLSLLILFLFIVQAPGAQEIVSSGGETQKVSGYEVSWTIGEPVTETLSGSANILTQGFHQPKLSVTPVSEFQKSGIELKVYPNPTSDFVIIQTNGLTENLRYLLFNINGKLLENELITSEKTKMNLKNYSGGQYVLKLICNSNQPVQNFKIIKR
jgi:hypothetical protein